MVITTQRGHPGPLSLPMYACQSAVPGQVAKRRRQPQRQWLSADIMVLVEKKCQKFVQWQEQHTNIELQQEYLTLCKQVRRATRADKEKWWDEKMTELEEDVKCNRQGDFFK